MGLANNTTLSEFGTGYSGDACAYRVDCAAPFLLKPIEPGVQEDPGTPECSARRGLASLGLNDITVVDIDPDQLPFGLEPGDDATLN